MGDDQGQAHTDILGADLRRASLADADTINTFLNHPDIRPHIGKGAEPVDIADTLRDERNVCLFDERGGALFLWRGPGVFEGHSFFLARGREALKAGREAIETMRNEADLIWGLTPKGNRHARWFNRQLGFVSLGETDRGELFEMRF